MDPTEPRPLEHDAEVGNEQQLASAPNLEPGQLPDQDLAATTGHQDDVHYPSEQEPGMGSGA